VPVTPDRIAVARAVHVTAAVLLLGNVVVTGFWAAYLRRRGDVVAFRAVARAVLLADLLFTLGGGVLLTVSGILLVLWRGYDPAATPWLAQGIVALALATLVWLVVLLPDQWRMARAADDARLGRVFVRWSVVGWLDTLLLFAGLWAMVTRR
jgi:uncharacterized membrane protein